MLYLLSAYYLPSLCKKPTLFDLSLRGVLWSSIISIPILPKSKLCLRKAKRVPERVQLMNRRLEFKSQLFLPLKCLPLLRHHIYNAFEWGVESRQRNEIRPWKMRCLLFLGYEFYRKNKIENLKVHEVPS